jgi:hypothetical protein
MQKISSLSRAFGICTIHLEVQELEEDNRVLLPLFIAFGITTVRDCASDMGEKVLKWRDEINSGQLFGPTLFTAGIKTGRQEFIMERRS